MGDSSVSLADIYVPVSNNLRVNCAFVVFQQAAPKQILLQRLTLGAGRDSLPTLSEAFYVGSPGVQHEVRSLNVVEDARIYILARDLTNQVSKVYKVNLATLTQSELVIDANFQVTDIVWPDVASDDL